ncbi:MAG TPA: RodZ domain-containing protein [Vicinamibacterales bacterium]|nr:RodZ domain-containing protein [Vicinamibacterales bacterium]
MDHRDYPQDEQQAGTAGPEPVNPGSASKFPSLIHDYRAQREAWREQARNLARMREEVLAAADHEARGIVSTARADVRRILLKARRDLLVLAAQVRAAGRLGEGEDTIDTPNFLPADDFGQAHNALTTARHDIRRVLDESRPELEGLASEGEALRAALHHHQPADVRRHVSRLPVQDVPQDRFEEAPADFDFISIDADDSPELTIRQPQFPIRALVAAAASFGALALMGTGVWMFWPSGRDNSHTETSAAAAAAPKPAARDSASPAVRTPIPEPRSPLSIRLSAKETSWVRVTADGRVTAERIFRPGETENIRASREVSIRAGDAGAVTVAVDGRQPVALGREGEVVTRRFTVQASRVERTAPAPVAATPRNPPAPVAQAPTQRQARASATPAAATAVAPLPPPRVIEQPRVTEQPVTAAPPPALPSPANPSASAPLSARPATASVERPPLTPPAVSPPSLQDVLTRDANRWLDAYYRQDRATMASISPQANVSDNRAEKERMPRGLSGVRRTLDEVRFQSAGTEVILTARMTERMDNAAAGQMAQAVSFVSQMWTQRNGSWQLMDVRIMSASAIARSLR